MSRLLLLLMVLGCGAVFLSLSDEARFRLSAQENDPKLQVQKLKQELEKKNKLLETERAKNEVLQTANKIAAKKIADDAKKQKELEAQRADLMELLQVVEKEKKVLQ